MLIDKIVMFIGFVISLQFFIDNLKITGLENVVLFFI